MRTRLLLPLLILIALAAGCTLFTPPPPTPTPTPPGQAIPFETLILDPWAWNEDAAALADYTAYQTPLTLLITSKAEVALLAKRASPEVLAQLEQVNYGEECVLALLRGYQGGSGMDVEIQRLNVQGNTLYVYADFWEPPVGAASQTAITSPRHIIKFPCALLPQPLAALQIELVPEIKLPSSEGDR